MFTFLNTAHEQAFYNFLNTSNGYAFVNQFMASNTTLTVCGETFSFTGGDRANDYLIINSEAQVNMDAAGGHNGDTRAYDKESYINGDDKSRQRSRLQFARENTDVSKGIVIAITLNDMLGTKQATQTLGHEAFVHGSSIISNLKSVLSKLSKGVYKNDKELYKKEVKNMDRSSDIDHEKLGNEGNEEFLNYSQELDSQNNSTYYEDAYNDERDQYKTK